MFSLDTQAYLNKPSGLNAIYKQTESDFIVNEIMLIKTDGDGEHCWLKVKKTGANTDYVANQLARFAGVKSHAVSYAGLKDRHAVTTQWFSVHIPGKQTPEWQMLQADDFQILESTRHSRKLKRGALSGNHFTLRLRELAGDPTAWDRRLELLAQYGVPNYFGPQRFGIELNNLYRAADMLEKKTLRKLKPAKRSIYLSAMRSWLFNQVVSERLSQQRFNQPEEGDVFMLADSQACFSEAVSEDICQRLAQHQLFLTAPLWGRGTSMASAAVAELENKVAKQWALFSAGLETAGLKQERRAMRLMPVNLSWEHQADNSLIVRFELTKGSYATSLLRELGNIRDGSEQLRK